MFWLGYIANEINKLRQRRYKEKESSVIKTIPSVFK